MLKKIKLKTKLIITFLVAGMLPLVIIGITSLNIATSALQQQAFEKVVSVRGIKKAQIQQYFSDAFLQMNIFTQGKDLQDFFQRLFKYHEDNNVTATGNYDVSTTEYNQIYSEYGTMLNKFQKASGYYDVFLICAKHGHVMYSAAKESDLGENLKYGKYKDTGLAKLWSKIAMTKKNAFVDMAPYAPSNGDPAMFAGYPIFDGDGIFIGVAAFQMALDQINKIMQQRDGMGKTGETYLVGADKLMRTDSFLDPTNHSVKASFANPTKGSVDTQAAREALSGKTGYKIIMDYLGNPVLSAFSSLNIGEYTWAILAEIDESEAFASIRNLRLIIIAVGGIALVLIVLIAFYIAGNISRPILKVVDYSEEMKKGDFSQKLDIQQSDEIGEMALSLNAMSENLANTIKDINDNTITLESSSTELSAISSQMASSSDSTVEKSNSVSAAAEEMNVNMTSVASAMEEATGNIDTVASASEEMNSSIEGIVKQVETAKKSTHNAVNSAGEVSQNVNMLGKDAEEISTVTEAIASISDKTNLLALNATIEAARAGEAGKGFAVVANEIKELANQTAEATTNISKKLKGIQNSTGIAVTGIEGITGVIKDINDVVVSINDTMGQQSSAIQEISENINQASLGVKEINQNISQTSEAAGQVASEISVVNESASEVSNSTAQLNQSADDLNQMAIQLKEKMEQFKI